MKKDDYSKYWIYHYYYFSYDPIQKNSPLFPIDNLDKNKSTYNCYKIESEQPNNHKPIDNYK
jgi:hypothetical protein